MPGLIQFSSPEQLRLFASHSRSVGSVQVVAREWGQTPYLHIDHHGRAGDEPICLAFAIPLRAIEGDVDALLLTVLGDGCGAVISLTCRGLSRPEFEIWFPPIDFTDRRTISTELPCGDAPQLGRLQIERLNIQIPGDVEHGSLGLFSLAALGACRVVSPAIA